MLFHKKSREDALSESISVHVPLGFQGLPVCGLLGLWQLGFVGVKAQDAQGIFINRSRQDPGLETGQFWWISVANL